MTPGEINYSSLEKASFFFFILSSSGGKIAPLQRTYTRLELSGNVKLVFMQLL